MFGPVLSPTALAPKTKPAAHGILGDSCGRRVRRAADGRLLHCGLRWIETPLMPHDTEGLVQLRRAVPTLPIATGEDHKGRHAFRELVERRCVGVRQPDLCWFGGLSKVLKVYVIGESTRPSPQAQ